MWALVDKDYNTLRDRFRAEVKPRLRSGKSKRRKLPPTNLQIPPGWRPIRGDPLNAQEVMLTSMQPEV